VALDDMKRRLYFGLTCLMWLALPITALAFRQNWDRLPLRVATHFNAANQPNGWMTREQALWSSLEMLAVLLTIFTLVLIFSHRREEITPFSWALLAFSYVVGGLGCYIAIATVNYNLDGRPINFSIFGIVFGISLVGIIVAHLGFRRGPRFTFTHLLAKEVHAVRAWAVLFIPMIVIELGAIAFLPNWGMRLGLGLVCLVLVLALAAVWRGFDYYFTPQGLEIHALGFRLKSVPADRIRHYSAENWSPICGYGIRGVGNSRAYVWGNRGVRIVTSDGYVFLGHNEPERIVRDLDAMMQVSKT
jgi:hypothetical protein